MSVYRTIHLGTRITSAVISIIWAIIHLYLFTQLVGRLPIVGYFFLFDGILAIVSSIILAIGIKSLYLPTLVY
ncbi:MAG: hypothetical protein QXV69_09695 [Sulfolobaceae archaeon]